jgi:hypothetical protein
MHIWFCNRRRIHIVPERLIICYLEEQDLAQIRDGLLNQRLGSYADSYLENLRDDARIVYK